VLKVSQFVKPRRLRARRATGSMATAWDVVLMD
jgi:hypothetical protein